ncbi:hypothetical protein HME01_25380 [Vreelandella aquamarina]|uniref:Uncharacterized protein n=1 Tax=Vreelandella aquamarina TaxID=77097 RepID=A0A6F8X7Q8_9GAMM|nr:hypothetical protein HMEPL2_06070 [Halomonas meridiana]GED46686.1 hypothetical protein HME01_25380 [Halomonas meridiana]
MGSLALAVESTVDKQAAMAGVNNERMESSFSMNFWGVSFQYKSLLR